MTPKNALTLLEQATGLLQLNRSDHDNIRLALTVLKALVEAAQLEPAKEVLEDGE